MLKKNEIINFSILKSEYEKYFDLYRKESYNKTLPPYILDWSKHLNEIQFNIWLQIRCIGVWLYPFYPIGNKFINFGNPYEKVGIEILYEDFIEEKENKIKLFEENGWKVFRISSRYDTLSVEELYEKQYGKNYGFVDENDYLNFINCHKKTNLECLLLYIRKQYEL